MIINGSTPDTVTLHIRGYRAYLTSLSQSTVIYGGNDETPTPELRTTSTPE